nr:hypothetical protein [uncultured Terrisporobacter sp.]
MKIKNEKNLKKVLTVIYYDDIVLLVLETRANEQHKLQKKLLKKVLTKNDKLDKLKKSKRDK